MVSSWTCASTSELASKEQCRDGWRLARGKMDDWIDGFVSLELQWYSLPSTSSTCNKVISESQRLVQAHNCVQSWSIDPQTSLLSLARHVDEGKSESGLLFWFEKTIRARDEKLYLMAMTCVWGKRIGLGAVRGTFASRRWLTVSWRWAAVVVLLHRLDWRQGNSNWNIM
jgi:hypothetical protein